MANPEQGETAIEIGGRIYTMKLTMNAMVEVEDAMTPLSSVCQKCGGTPERVTFTEVLRLSNSNSMKHILAIVWGSLRKYHPALTMSQVGELVDEAGGIIAFNAKLDAMNRAAQPDARDVKTLGGGKRPRKGVAQTAGTTTPF